MPSQYSQEVEAIRQIRGLNPALGPYVLARRIKSGSVRLHNDTDGSNALAIKCRFRPFYSILSVIRRFDDKRRQTAAA
jgi:hypothetical protein